MRTVTASSRTNNVAISSLDLTLVITDPNVLGYLAAFDDEEKQCVKALEALKVGVIAIRSASPTLDTQVVREQFSELEGKMREHLTEMQRMLRMFFVAISKSTTASCPGRSTGSSDKRAR
jgi:hypothetical protein